MIHASVPSLGNDTYADTVAGSHWHPSAITRGDLWPELRTHPTVAEHARTSPAPTGSSLQPGYATGVSTAEDIPEGLRATGFSGPQGEIAWDPDDAIEVAQWLNQARRAVLSGDALGWFADGSVCDTLSPADPNRRLVSGWDVRGPMAGEQWEDYCRFCLDSAVVALHDSITPGDVLEKVVAVRYRLSWRDSIAPSGPEPLPGNPAARYWA